MPTGYRPPRRARSSRGPRVKGDSMKGLIAAAGACALSATLLSTPPVSAEPANAFDRAISEAGVAYEAAYDAYWELVAAQEAAAKTVYEATYQRWRAQNPKGKPSVGRRLASKARQKEYNSWVPAVMAAEDVKAQAGACSTAVQLSVSAWLAEGVGPHCVWWTYLTEWTSPEGRSISTVPTEGPNWQQQMLDQVNAIRAEVGASPLQLCSNLLVSAQQYGERMARYDTYSHTGVDLSSSSERIRQTGYASTWSGENIAAGQRSVSEAVQAWRNSPGHYRNMINPNYIHVGFGYGGSEQASLYSRWVQNFAAGDTCDSSPAVPAPLQMRRPEWRVANVTASVVANASGSQGSEITIQATAPSSVPAGATYVVRVTSSEWENVWDGDWEVIRTRLTTPNGTLLSAYPVASIRWVSVGTVVPGYVTTWTDKVPVVAR